MAAVTQGKQPEKPKVEYKKYFCSRCKYNFRFKVSSEQSLKCPNCGTNSNLIQDNFNLNKVIEESSNKKYDR